MRAIPCHGLGLEPKAAVEEWTITTRVETRLLLAPIKAKNLWKHSVTSYLNSSHHKTWYFENYLSGLISFKEWFWARSIRPKISVWISDIFVCRMERYFPPRQTDLVPFPLEHILLGKMLKDHGKMAVLSTVSCFMERNLTHIHNYS